MDRSIRGWLLLVAAVLAACASGNAVFKPTPLQDPDHAMVYIYRPEATSPGLAKPLRFSHPEVFVGDLSLGALEYNRYLAVELPPGEHELRLTGLTAGASDWDIRDIRKKLDLAAGQSTFLRLRVEYNLSQMNLGQPQAQYHIQLTPVAEQDAIYEIRHVEPAQ